MAETMLNRIERIIAESGTPRCDSDRCTCSGYERWECAFGSTPDQIARAVIEAMREPTYEMRMSVPPRVGKKLDYREVGDAWKSMIDAVS
jgi:hypothetical protein